MIAIAEIFNNTENQNQLVYIETAMIRKEGGKYLAEVTVEELERLARIGYEVYTDKPAVIQILKKNQIHGLDIPALEDGQTWSSET